MSFRMLAGQLVLVAVVTSAASPASASDMSSDFLSCAQIGGAARRLACYDRVAGSADSLPVGEQPDFRPTKPLHSKVSPAPSASVTIDVVSFGNMEDKPVFRLVNGQVWEGEDDDPVFPEADHNKVTIFRSSLGLGYHLRMNQEIRELVVRRIR